MADSNRTEQNPKNSFDQTSISFQRQQQLDQLQQQIDILSRKLNQNDKSSPDMSLNFSNNNFLETDQMQNLEQQVMKLMMDNNQILENYDSDAKMRDNIQVQLENKIQFLFQENSRINQQFLESQEEQKKLRLQIDQNQKNGHEKFELERQNEFLLNENSRINTLYLESEENNKNMRKNLEKMNSDQGQFKEDLLKQLILQEQSCFELQRELVQLQEQNNKLQKEQKLNDENNFQLFQMQKEYVKLQEENHKLLKDHKIMEQENIRLSQQLQDQIEQYEELYQREESFRIKYNEQFKQIEQQKMDDLYILQEELVRLNEQYDLIQSENRKIKMSRSQEVENYKQEIYDLKDEMQQVKNENRRMAVMNSKDATQIQELTQNLRLIEDQFLECQKLLQDKSIIESQIGNENQFLKQKCQNLSTNSEDLLKENKKLLETITNLDQKWQKKIDLQKDQYFSQKNQKFMDLEKINYDLNIQIQSLEQIAKQKEIQFEQQDAFYKKCLDEFVHKNYSVIEQLRTAGEQKLQKQKQKGDISITNYIFMIKIIIDLIDYQDICQKLVIISVENERLNKQIEEFKLEIIKLEKQIESQQKCQFLQPQNQNMFEKSPIKTKIEYSPLIKSSFNQQNSNNKQNINPFQSQIKNDSNEEKTLNLKQFHSNQRVDSLSIPKTIPYSQRNQSPFQKNDQNFDQSVNQWYRGVFKSLNNNRNI